VRFKIAILGLSLFVVGFSGAFATCPSGNCPNNTSTAFAGSTGFIGLVLIPVGLVWAWYASRRKPSTIQWPNAVSADPGTFMSALSMRLGAGGFSTTRNVDIPPYRLDTLAWQSRLEVSKFGQSIRIIAVAMIQGTLDIGRVLDFSSRVTKYALENPGTGLPRGFGSGVFVFPVIVSEDFDDGVKNWVTKNFAPKHWAAVEFPVLISTKQQRAYYCTKTRIWGAAYYRGFRRFVDTSIGVQHQ
jgi:hypothetical protein